MKKLLTLLLLTLLPLSVSASLTLPASSSTAKIDFGNPDSLNDLDPFTILMWLYPTGSFATNQRIYIKGNGAIFRVHMLDTTSPVDFRVRRSRNAGASSDDYQTSSGPLVENKWNFIAITYNSAGATGERINVYSGDLSTPAIEAAYASRTDGTGAITTDAAGTLKVGGEDINNLSVAGHYAFISVLAEELSLGQIRSMQFFPRVRSSTRLFSHFGFNGTTNVPDWSGKRNVGTITSATVFRHVPLGNLFGR